MKWPRVMPSFQFAGAVGAIALLLGGIAGSIGGWKLGSTHWEGRYHELEAEGWKQEAAIEKTARQAAEERLVKVEATAKHNQETIRDLETENARIAADSAVIRRQLGSLRLAASRPIPRCPAMPETPGQLGATGAGGNSGDDAFSRLAGAAIDECRRNANRFDKLIRQVTPQTQ